MITPSVNIGLGIMSASRAEHRIASRICGALHHPALVRVPAGMANFEIGQS